MIGTILKQRFTITEEIGRGGMGVVYRAHDDVLDRDVAVKMVSGVNLGTEGRERLLREAKAIARLNHSNVVAVHDAGEEDDIPYIVMEYVEGKTLHEAPPTDFAEIVAVTAQICQALDHAHAHKVVHRDLKPENVIIDADGTAKLMDFGIARSVASRVTSEGEVIGTVFYLAPEIALVQEYDGRADLYALGVMLYELTTGNLPFVEGDPVAVISQHLHASVVPPRSKNPDIPPRLDALIARMMSKSPADRPDSASEVHAVLTRPDLLDPEAEEVEEIDVYRRIARGRFVARERELKEAKAVWNTVFAGEGQTLLISGEPGVGKSRFVRELMTYAEVSGGKAYVGESYAEGNAPYAPFAQIVRSALRGSSQNGVEVANFVLADLISLAPELRVNYPDVPPNPSLEPDAEQRRMFENVVTLFAGLAEKIPQTLVIEDAHWADSGTLALLLHLSRRTKKHKIFIITTFREVELDVARPFNQALSELNRARLARELKLGRFNQAQTSELLAAIFEDETTQDFLAGIQIATEGNPFFVEEVCKGLVEGGQVFHTDDGWDRLSMDEIEIPRSVKVTIQSRLARLPQEHQESLTLAAILGREFDFDTLELASDLEEDALILSLESAERAQLIEEVSGAGGATFSFVHALIRSTLVENVRTLSRRKLHGRASEAIASLHPDNYEDLAYHYEEAGDQDRARQSYKDAGDRAASVYANQEGEDHYRAALELSRTVDEQADVLSKLGMVLSRQAKYEEAINTWERAIDLHRRTKAQDQISWFYARIVRAAWNSGDLQGSLEFAKQGIEEIADAPDSPELADLLHETARAYLFSGFENEATPICRRALSMAENTGSSKVQAESLITIGAFKNQSYGEAIEALEAAIRLAEKHLLPNQESRARHNLAFSVLASEGDVAAAQMQFQRAAEIAKMTGELHGELLCRSNRNIWTISLGELGAAEKEIQALWDLSKEAEGAGMGLRSVRWNESWLWRVQGHLDAAAKSLRNLLEEAHASGIKWGMLNDHLSLGEIYIAQGDLDAALREFDQAIVLSDELIDERARSRSLKSMVLSIQGQVSEARLLLQESRDIFSLKPRVFEQYFIDIAQGFLSASEGDWTKASNAFEQAVALQKKHGLRWREAWTLQLWAEARLQSGEPEDIRRARELLNEAIHLFQAMPAPGQVDLIQARLKQLNH